MSKLGRVGEIPEPLGRSVPRYSSRAFPAYRYVPGLQPHPTRDPAGHAYQVGPTANGHRPWMPAEWPLLDDWLYGVDLFNRFYFWEAHEAWEALWASAPKGSSQRLLLQGLIQSAAALLKTHMGVLAGARVLSSEGLAKLREVGTSNAMLLGLDIAATERAFAQYWQPLESGRLPAIDSAVPLLRLDC